MLQYDSLYSDDNSSVNSEFSIEEHQMEISISEIINFKCCCKRSYSSFFVLNKNCCHCSSCHRKYLKEYTCYYDENYSKNNRISLTMHY